MANKYKWDDEEDDRYTKGKDSIKIFVEEVPETCMECPFYVKNINKDNLEDPSFYCLLRSALVSAQFAGTDITEPKQYKCPLLNIKDSELIQEMQETIDELVEIAADHEERIRRLEAG